MLHLFKLQALHIRVEAHIDIGTQCVIIKKIEGVTDHLGSLRLH